MLGWSKANDNFIKAEANFVLGWNVYVFLVEWNVFIAFFNFFLICVFINIGIMYNADLVKPTKSLSGIQKYVQKKL